MRALTLLEPWATLVVLGKKEWETRSWPTKIRERVAIHASKGFPRKNQDICFEEHFFKALRRHGVEHSRFAPGCVIGFADILDCLRTEDVRDTLTADEIAFGDWSDGRWCYRLGNPETTVPIPARGALNFWRWKNPRYPLL